MGKKEKVVTTKYKIGVNGLAGCKIALVSDLHDRPGRTAIEILKKEKPDLILAAGDMIERCTEGESEYTMAIMDQWQGYRQEKTPKATFIRAMLHIGDFLHVRDAKFESGLNFLKEISSIAPVYYGMGNHEWYFYPEDRLFFKEHGICLLDNEDVICEFPKSGFKNVRIGGLSTRYDLDWLTEYSKKEGPKILIAHHPEYYLRYIKGTENDTFDLIVSGHVHGGQWRIGGKSVLAPGQGLFPKYGYGFLDGKLVIGAGLSNTTSVPRIGNPMEVVIVEIE